MTSAARCAARCLTAALFASTASPNAGGARPVRQALDVRAFRPVEGPNSGDAVYYHVEATPEGAVLRGTYTPGRETVTMGVEVPKPMKQRARLLRWRWRPLTFPHGGDECTPGKGDSAAVVSVAWKGGLRWYVLRYVWSPVSPLGATCDRKRSLFLFRDTIILERAGAPGTWRTELVDVRRSFIERFADGNPHANVPDLVGIGVLTDGDQTNSLSAAEWADFELSE